MKAIYLCGLSAAEYWWRYGRRGLEDLAQTYVRTFARAAQSAEDLRELELDSLPGVAGLSRPLHILIGNRSQRINVPDAVCHIWSLPIPDGAYLRVRPEVYVSSPEFTFVQLAFTLCFADLVRYGFELCGNYCVQPDLNARFYERPPLSSAHKLQLFTSRVRGAKNIKNAREAARWVCDNAASPMEALECMLFYLPFRHGGFGFPRPELNAEIPVRQKQRGRVHKGVFYCDLYWPKFNEAFEYDSDDCHIGRIQHNRDAIRRGDLDFLGVHVTQITSGQLENLHEVNELGKRLAKRIGRRLYINQSFYSKQYNLHSLLFDFRRMVPWFPQTLFVPYRRPGSTGD